MPRDIKRVLEKRASDLRHRLETEEEQRNEMRTSGRQALEIADTLLQSVEQSLECDGGALSARNPRGASSLPPLYERLVVRPDTGAVASP